MSSSSLLSPLPALVLIVPPSRAHRSPFSCSSLPGLAPIVSHPHAHRYYPHCPAHPLLLSLSSTSLSVSTIGNSWIQKKGGLPSLLLSTSTPLLLGLQSAMGAARKEKRGMGSRRCCCRRRRRRYCLMGTARNEKRGVGSCRCCCRRRRRRRAAIVVVAASDGNS